MFSLLLLAQFFGLGLLLGREDRLVLVAKRLLDFLHLRPLLILGERGVVTDGFNLNSFLLLQIGHL